MKNCIHCGRELPDEASFCPYCETEQAPPQEVSMPPIRRRWRARLIALLCVLLVIGGLYAALRPRVYDAQGAELNYRGYHVLVNFAGSSDQRLPGEEKVKIVPAHAEYSYPSQLYIYRRHDTVNAREKFMAKVANVSLTTEPRDGATQMQHEEPAHVDFFPDAALKASVYYDSTCGTNDITWTIRMKNGDQLILHQHITAIPQEEKIYYASEYDMSTMDALQELMAKIEAEESPDAMVSLYLPPVTYEGRLTISNRSYMLYGTSAGDQATTFTDTVTIEEERPGHSEIHGVRFAGSGGTGLFASRGVGIEECTFTGWDVAAAANDGAWIGVHDCDFIGNGVALQYDTGKSTLATEDCEDCLFADNGIAVHFEHVPQQIHMLRFPRTVFRGNEEDISNNTNIITDISEAIFE